MVVLGANEIMIKMIGHGIQARKERPDETSKISQIQGTGDGYALKVKNTLVVEGDLVVKERISV